jgi:hypothetical protein
MSSTFSLYSGDSKTLTIPLTLDGSAFNPSGFLLIFTAKKSVTDDDSKALIQKVTGTGLTVSGTTATIDLVPQDTASLARENLFCDIQAQNLTTGAVATVAFFRLRIDRDVTRSTTTSIPVVTAAPGVPIGPTGATGPANSLSIAGVTTGAAGSSASVSVGGTAPSQTLAFTLPQGDKGEKGDTGTLSVGSVSTGPAGSNVAITNSGSASAATLNFTIPRGDVGVTGPTGPANTLSVAGVTTGAAGSAAAVTIGGTSPSQTLTFAIPKGDKGDAATVTVGTVSTGVAGSSATVSNTGTSAAAVLAFSIPRGNVGETGATGAAATVALGNVATGAAGSSVAITNTGTTGAAVFDFTIPRGDVGVTGETGSAGATGPAGYPAIILFETVSDTTKTITPAAAGVKFRFTNAAGCAITIQPDASGAWTAGQIVYFRRVTGAGALTFNNTGITINGISGVLAGEEFALHQVAANTFDFI